MHNRTTQTSDKTLITIKTAILTFSCIAAISCEDSSKTPAPEAHNVHQDPQSAVPPVEDPAPLVYPEDSARIIEDSAIEYTLQNIASDNCDQPPCISAPLDACDLVQQTHAVAIIQVRSVEQRLRACGESPFRFTTTEMDVETLSVLGGSPVPRDFKLYAEKIFSADEAAGTLLMVSLRRTHEHWISRVSVPLRFISGPYSVDTEMTLSNFDVNLPESIAELKASFGASMQSDCRLDDFLSDDDFRDVIYRENSACSDEPTRVTRAPRED